MRSGWLLREGDVVCALEMADTWPERLRGARSPIGPDGVGARHRDRVQALHGVGLSCPIDVAFLSADLTVLRTGRLAPWRVAIGGRRARSVLECEAGALERWGLQVGDQLVIREVQ